MSCLLVEETLVDVLLFLRQNKALSAAQEAYSFAFRKK